MATATAEMPAAAEEFDPATHATDTDGNPVLTTDGKYAKRRGPKAGARPAPSPRKSARPKAAPRASAARPKAPDFRPGLNGVFQLIATPLAFTQPLDAVAVANHGPNIAEALNDLAQERPEVAAVLQRILAVGPYGAVIAATLPLVVQLLHNHDVLPAEPAERLGATRKSALQEMLGIVPKPDPENTPADLRWGTADNVVDNVADRAPF